MSSQTDCSTLIIFLYLPLFLVTILGEMEDFHFFLLNLYEIDYSNYSVEWFISITPW